MEYNKIETREGDCNPNIALVEDQTSSDHTLQNVAGSKGAKSEQPLQRTGTIPMKCDHCHGGRDTPCTCSAADDDEQGSWSEAIRCSCLAWMDAVSPARVG